MACGEILWCSFFKEQEKNTKDRANGRVRVTLLEGESELS